MPTTTPAELTPKALAAVEPRFRTLAERDLSGLVTKLLKFPLLSMVNPTEFPLFEIPFWLVPLPALVPALGPSKLVNWKPPSVDLVQKRDARTVHLLRLFDAVVFHVENVSRRPHLLHVMRHHGTEQRAPFQRVDDRANASLACGSLVELHVIISR